MSHEPVNLEPYLGLVKPTVAVMLLAVFWTWETWRPFFGGRVGRVRHAGRNLTVAVLNGVVVGLAFGYATVSVAAWTAAGRLGLLQLVELPWAARLAVALVLLDGWMYVWHRLIHSVPFLWRFHRMHHSDDQMDVTTATRFHLGELFGSGLARLGLIPLLGLDVWQLVIYDALVLAVTQLHHANVSLGRWDRPLRFLVVTPFMHKVHHSRLRPETNSNYSTVLSLWDRLFGSYRERTDPATIHLGLDEFDEPRWQTVSGMLTTPLADHGAKPAEPGRPSPPFLDEVSGRS